MHIKRLMSNILWTVGEDASVTFCIQLEPSLPLFRWSSATAFTTLYFFSLFHRKPYLSRRWRRSFLMDICRDESLRCCFAFERMILANKLSVSPLETLRIEKWRPTIALHLPLSLWKPSTSPPPCLCRWAWIHRSNSFGGMSSTLCASGTNIAISTSERLRHLWGGKSSPWA